MLLPNCFTFELLIQFLMAHLENVWYFTTVRLYDELCDYKILIFIFKYEYLGYMYKLFLY